MEPELEFPEAGPLPDLRGELPCRAEIREESSRMRRAERWVGGPSASGLAALVSACAGAPRDASLPIDDPNEQFNRGVLRVNQAVLDPAANVVKQAPGQIRDRSAIWTPT